MPLSRSAGAKRRRSIRHGGPDLRRDAAAGGVIGQHRVDLVGCDLDQGFQEGGDGYPVGLLLEPGEGELEGAVRSGWPAASAAFGATKRWSYWFCINFSKLT